MSRACRILILIGTTVASHATAQLRGSVLDPVGHPIVGATIAVWQGAAEIARTNSGARGTFYFSREELKRADGIAVRAIGFRPQIRQWNPADSILTVTLQLFAAPLPDVVVPGLTIECPRTDNAVARDLWTALRAKYDLTPQNVGVLVRMSWTRETAYASELGSIDERRLSRSMGEAGLYGTNRLHGYRLLPDSGYAVSRRDPKGELPASLDGGYFEWWYPSFHRWHSDHFLEVAFGRLQVFSLAEASGGLPSLRFCSRDHRRPFVAGVLLLGPDTTVIEAAWQFHTPRPNERAGGHAWYLPLGAVKGVPRYLLPTIAVFWRQRGGQKGLYFHDSAIYHEWHFGPGVEIPNLPRATPGRWDGEFRQGH
jgi:hypothetical protein